MLLGCLHNTLPLSSPVSALRTQSRQGRDMAAEFDGDARGMNRMWVGVVRLLVRGPRGTGNGERRAARREVLRRERMTNASLRAWNTRSPRRA